MTVEKYSVAGRTCSAAVAGALTAAGLAVTADSTGWFAVGAGVVTAAGFAVWASSRRVQLARMEIDGQLGGPSVETDRRNRALDAHAFPESISTLRIVSNISAQEDISFRSAVDPVLTKMNVLVTGPLGTFRSSALDDVQFDNLPELEQPREVTVLRSSAGGSVALHERADVEPGDVADPRTVTAPYPAPPPRGRIGRGRRAAIGVCLGFAVAASATSVVLPDAGFVQEAAEFVIDGMGGSDRMSEVSDEIEDALQELREVNADAATHLRSLSITDTSWELVAYDPAIGQDLTIRDYDGDPSYTDSGTSAGTFEISDADIPNFQSMYNELVEAYGEDAVDGVDVEVPEGGDQPVVTWALRTTSAVTEVDGGLDGSLANLFDPSDIGVALNQLQLALESFGSGADQQVLYRLVLRMSSDEAPYPISGPNILAQGGAGGVVELPGGEYAGGATVAAEVGRFPALVAAAVSYGYKTAPPFALSDVSPGQINAVVDAAAKELGADAGDRRQMTITIDRLSGDDPELTVAVQFAGTSPSRYCAGLDGDTSAC